MLIELFGNIYKEVEDSGSECACPVCALYDVCEMTKPYLPLPCERADGSINRHFIRVSINIEEE